MQWLREDIPTSKRQSQGATRLCYRELKRKCYPAVLGKIRWLYFCCYWNQQSRHVLGSAKFTISRYTVNQRVRTRYSSVRLFPPGYKPTSASVPLKGFPDCFCFVLHSKVHLFSPTGCKHKPASILRICPPTHAKKSVCRPTAENHLLKLANRM